MSYLVLLKNLKLPEQIITLEECSTKEHAEQQRKVWRKLLGGKHWTVDRRPGLDTLDHLALTIENKEEK